MDSTDREILLDISGRLVRIESRVERVETRLDGLESRVAVMENELRLQSARTDWMQTTIYWGFAIIGVICAFVPLLRREKPTDSPQPPTQIYVYSPQVMTVTEREGVKQND